MWSIGRWPQAYRCDYFCAVMTTTQRSESINNFLQNYFGTNIILREFVDQYSKAMVIWHETEREVENKTHQTSSILLTKWSIEREASDKYTQKIVYSFQRERQENISLRLQLEKDEKILTHKVLELDGRKKSYNLTYIPADQSVLYSCKKFEFY